MTPAQIAELEELNAAVEAAPDAPEVWEARARFRASLGADLPGCVEDCARALQLKNEKLGARAWARRGREHWKKGYGDVRDDAVLWHWAQSIACFGRALERAPNTAGWLIERARVWVLVGIFAQLDEENERAENDLRRARELEGASAPLYRVHAELADSKGQKWIGKVLLKKALQLEIERGKWVINRRNCLRRARSIRVHQYERMAWFELAIEAAPDTKLMLEYALFLEDEGEARHAQTLYDRAIEMRPDDPKNLNARAYHFLFSRRERGRRPSSFELAAADFRSAIRAREAVEGKVGDASSWRARGDAWMKKWDESGQNVHDGDGYSLAIAHAFYSLALEKAPCDASLYLARARALEAEAFGGCRQTFWEWESAFFDWRAALKWDAQLEAARVGAIKFLIDSLKRDSAHEQIEALLAARQTLLDFGLKPQLVAQIMGEVEAALRA